jgi:hypothetical protein
MNCQQFWPVLCLNTAENRLELFNFSTVKRYKTELIFPGADNNEMGKYVCLKILTKYANE